MILFGSMVVPATVLTFATTGGRRRIRVGAGTVAFTAVAGGILGTVAAATLEYDSLRALGALPMLMVGLIEEASKIVVPTAVFLIDRRLRWPEAAVLGVASGAGFATLETMGHGFNALLSGGLEPSTALCSFAPSWRQPDTSPGQDCQWRQSDGSAVRRIALAPSLSLLVYSWPW